jgi:hypothetical protein
MTQESRFRGFTPRTVKFFTDLKKHNTRTDILTAFFGRAAGDQ